MKTQTIVERRTFLTSTAAVLVANTIACGDDEGAVVRPQSSDAGERDAGRHGDAGGTATGSGNAEGSDAGRSGARDSDAGGSDARSSSSEVGTGGLDSSTTSSTSSADGGWSGSETRLDTGATSTLDDTSSTDVPAADACFEGGGVDGGQGDDAGAGVLCSTNTDNGNHCHALVVPHSDVESGIPQATYLLEDGGTGHTHTITLTAYDFFYLQAGVATTVESTENAGHTHTCLITCPV